MRLVQRLQQNHMPLVLVLLLGVVVAAQGCLPGERANDPLPDVKVDVTVADGGKSDAKVDAKADGSLDTATDVADEVSETTADVPILTQKGCLADGDCLSLPLLPCHLVPTCNVETGLCESALAVEATPCTTDACLVGETCDATGVCGGGKAKNCDDKNACTLDLCGNGVCTHPNVVAGSCDDGVKCTVGDHCVAGKCVSTPLDCSDGNPCTDDSCHESGDPTGNVMNLCQHSTFTYASKSVACAVTDPLLSPFCNNGNCGVGKDCDDKNDCTTDTQDPITGDCVNAYVGDGIACGTDKCTTAGCKMVLGAGAVSLPTCVTKAKCDDGKFCTKDVCDPSTGNCDSKTTLTAGTPCTTTDPCVIDGQCDGKTTCKSTKPVACNDGNPCTDDSCISGLGCTGTPVTKTTACNDGNGCTTGDTCANGVCGGTQAVVDDGNACTNDACDPMSGITHTPVGDGTACGTSSACSKGICVAK